MGTLVRLSRHFHNENCRLRLNEFQVGVKYMLPLECLQSLQVAGNRS